MAGSSRRLDVRLVILLRLASSLALLALLRALPQRVIFAIGHHALSLDRFCGLWHGDQLRMLRVVSIHVEVVTRIDHCQSECLSAINTG